MCGQTSRFLFAPDRGVERDRPAAIDHGSIGRAAIAQQRWRSSLSSAGPPLANVTAWFHVKHRTSWPGRHVPEAAWFHVKQIADGAAWPPRST